jgi:hypothetical protein
MIPVILTTWSVATAGAMPAVHWQAVYLDGRGGHVVEGWRAEDRQVRRVTDGGLELYGARDAEVGFRFVLLDRRRGVSFRGTAADRARAGSFDDWEQWTRGVAAPPDAAVALGSADETPAGLCRWLVAPGRAVCWSKRWHLPLVVRAGGRVVYAVTAAEATGAIAPVETVGLVFADDD